MTDEHDKLAYRLAQILSKLHNGETVETQSLADEFNVHIRTIQRDLNERFDFLNLTREGEGYRASDESLGHLTPDAIERFACLAGVRDLFPDMGAEALLKRLNDPQATVLVHAPHHEVLKGEPAIEVFEKLEFAVLGSYTVGFRYRKDDGSKIYDPVQPYKLVNHAGVWYLAAHHGGQLKSFSLTKIDGLLIEADKPFTPDPALLEQLAREDSVWLKPVKTEVRLLVAKAAADYFRRRKLLPNQATAEDRPDGSLVLTCKVAHENEILPIVRYWMPNVRVLSPATYREAHKQLIQDHLDTL